MGLVIPYKQPKLPSQAEFISNITVTSNSSNVAAAKLDIPLNARWMRIVVEASSIPVGQFVGYIWYATGLNNPSADLYKTLKHLPITQWTTYTVDIDLNTLDLSREIWYLMPAISSSVARYRIYFFEEYQV